MLCTTAIPVPLLLLLTSFCLTGVSSSARVFKDNLWGCNSWLRQFFSRSTNSVEAANGSVRVAWCTKFCALNKTSRKLKQEAQLPQRDSASATHVFLGSLTGRALHWAPHLFYKLHNRLVKLVSTLSANKLCKIRTLSWIWLSRSFKVILIGAGRNPEWSLVVMCN